MKKLLLFALLISVQSFGQIKGASFTAKEFSKDIALFKAKEFLFRDVFISNNEVVQFETIPLAASNSGELTTLLYRCDSKNLDGLVFGFYGSYWNESGVSYQGYAFKNLNKSKAIDFLNKIDKAIEDNSKFLKSSNDNNNIFFKFEDIDVLIWTGSGGYTIRLFWNGFDSSWEKTAFERSKRRFEKKI